MVKSAMTNIATSRSKRAYYIAIVKADFEATSSNFFKQSQFLK